MSLQFFTDKAGSRVYVQAKAVFESDALSQYVFSFASGTAYTLSALAGSFALTGENATLSVALTANAGSFTLTGQNTILGPAIPEGVGSFGLNGQNATLAVSMTTAAGAFTLTGENATPAVGLPAAFGAFSVAGENADLTYTQGGIVYILSANAGAFALTGEQATLTLTHPVVIQKPTQLVGWGRWYRYADLFSDGKRKLEALQKPPETIKPREPELSPVMSAALQRLGSRPRRTVTFKPLDIEPARQSVQQYGKYEAHKTRERRDREAVEV